MTIEERKDHASKESSRWRQHSSSSCKQGGMAMVAVLAWEGRVVKKFVKTFEIRINFFLKIYLILNI